jgi:superkiller protein 3
MRKILLWILVAGIALGLSAVVYRGRTAPTRTERTPAVASLAELQARADKNPQDARVFTSLGQRLLQLGLTASAHQALAHAAQIEGGKAGLSGVVVPIETLLQDADMLQQQEHYADAECAYRSILARAPAEARAYQGLGEALYEQGKRDAAYSVVQHALALNPNLPEAEFTLAHIYYDVGFPDEATSRLTKVVQASPQVPRYWHALGLAQGKSPLHYAEAEEALRRAVTLAPNDPRYLTDLGAQEAKNNHPTEAVQHLRHAQTLAPKDPYVLAGLGKFLLKNRPSAAGLQEAETVLTKAHAARPTDLDVVFGLGDVAFQRGDMKQAIAQFESISDVAPGFANTYYMLARAYQRLGNRARANYCMRLFHSLYDLHLALINTEEQASNQKKNPKLRLKLARLYAQTGDTVKAINQYQMYLTLSPRDQAVKKEMDSYIAQLKAHKALPPLTMVNGMVTASSL